jgi:hypothetical protein
MPAKPTKCARTACKRRTVNPKARGWLWIEITPSPPKTGWYCPECAAGLQRVLAGQGVTPTIERLH